MPVDGGYEYESQRVKEHKVHIIVCACITCQLCLFSLSCNHPLMDDYKTSWTGITDMTDTITYMYYSGVAA